VSSRQKQRLLLPIKPAELMPFYTGAHTFRLDEERLIDAATRWRF
jgi:hypothetical protein